MLKYVLFFMDLINVISSIISQWKNDQAKEAGRQEVKAAQQAADTKAKAIAQEIHTRVDSLSDADLDAQLRAFRRD